MYDIAFKGHTNEYSIEVSVTEDTAKLFDYDIISIEMYDEALEAFVLVEQLTGDEDYTTLELPEEIYIDRFEEVLKEEAGALLEEESEIRVHANTRALSLRVK